MYQCVDFNFCYPILDERGSKSLQRSVQVASGLSFECSGEYNKQAQTQSSGAPVSGHSPSIVSTCRSANINTASVTSNTP